MTPIEAIRAKGELTIQKCRPISGIDFGYNRDSVRWLEGFIERTRASWMGNFAGKQRMEDLFGSFLGECMVRCHGGSWKNQGVWFVAFDDGSEAYPFAKVAKQMENGLEDGIGGFFDIVSHFRRIPIPVPPAPQKPWWKLW